jgi:choline dehydrogenase-like flavoprotein
MNNTSQKLYDVVIVGSGIAGGLVALQLGKAGKKVLVLEAGDPVATNINAEMDRFYRSAAKVPESPYTPELLKDPATVPAGRPTVLSLSNSEDWRDPSKSYMIQTGTVPFSSTYERTAGGTSVHWLGTCLRLLPSDFDMKHNYELNWEKWPITYLDIERKYREAEWEIGVSASVEEQTYAHLSFGKGYQYPMPAIPQSLVDKFIGTAISGMKFGDGVDGKDTELRVRSTPAARNSRPFKQRRTCAGNTNCIPICPIQAKYDPTVTLRDAQATGKVEFRYRAVACEIVVGDDGQIHRLEYWPYDEQGKKIGDAPVRVSAQIYVIAANAIETPRLLLMSTGKGKRPSGVANSSGEVGKNLMDHPMYVPWGLLPQSRFPYRGPLSTSGIEDLRDGNFRKDRAAFRIEIGNEGWNFAVGGDPNITTVDLVNGLNNSQVNPNYDALFGDGLVTRLRDSLTRQFRLGFLVEQEPDERNRVTLSEKYKDGLGLPRPEVYYSLSDYTIGGLAAAKKTADAIFARLNATDYTRIPDRDDPTAIELPPNEAGRRERIRFLGAGHIMGTYRMGEDPSKSVVNSFQQSHDHKNLYLIGSGVFPTSATANPTLTIAALSLRTAEQILARPDFGKA